MNRPIWDNPNFIQGNLLPDYPSSYNIGSEERPFKDLWLSGDIHLTGDIYIDEVLLGDGSAADPSLSFQLDQDTGFYRVGANEIGVAIGGVQRTTFDTYGQTVVLNSALSGRPGLTITNQSTSTAARAGIALYNNLGQQGSLYITSSPGPGAGDLYIDVDAGREINFAHGGTVAAHVDTTGIAAISGTAAAPSYAFLDDTNTGIYSVAADQLNITTGGANRLSVANTFIGIASGLQLYAPGTGTAAAPDYTFNGDVNTGVYRVGADNLGVAAGGAQVAGFNTGGVSVLVGGLAQPVATGVSAAGTTIADATALSAIWNRIGTVAAGTGVKMWDAAVGVGVGVHNAGANPLLVYPEDAAEQINALGAGNGFTIAAGSSAIFVRMSSTLWNTFTVG